MQDRWPAMDQGAAGGCSRGRRRSRCQSMPRSFFLYHPSSSLLFLPLSALSFSLSLCPRRCLTACLPTSVWGGRCKHKSACSPPLPNSSPELPLVAGRV